MEPIDAIDVLLNRMMAKIEADDLVTIRRAVGALIRAAESVDVADVDLDALRIFLSTHQDLPYDEQLATVGKLREFAEFLGVDFPDSGGLGVTPPPAASLH
jgi:hypothetical protein